MCIGETISEQIAPAEYYSTRSHLMYDGSLNNRISDPPMPCANALRPSAHLRLLYNDTIAPVMRKASASAIA